MKVNTECLSETFSLKDLKGLRAEGYTALEAGLRTDNLLLAAANT